ncbi:hypothetical protein OG455_28235 [Kitasatospora sp. NBC_01287]|uniref:hypothetical protein n=1 Tax=Kitasatospora sp. NBC_01287 TaxID=2903573 RepID=UPI00225B8D13|nr:hypothetical protein [Kitasatospora sp. NBC_01287]MCX4749351.1 hypothetical protein [Kitasatospora sp. NBC_01287]
MTTEQTTRDAVRRVLGDVHTEVTEFPGGNVAIAVSGAAHSATIDGHPDTGYGWTTDPGEDDGCTGHERIAATLDDALAAVRAAFTAR